MIDQTDARLGDWVGSVLQGAIVSFAPPSDVQTGKGVSLHLLEIVPAPRAGSTRRLPLQLALRYLVTTWGERPEEAHRLLGELVFAAMENSEFEVEFESIPVTAWMGFGAKPRPSFVLRVPLRFERPELPAKLVRKPIVVRTTLLTTLQGVVLTRDEVPLVGAQVKVPAYQLSDRTDSNGRFSFAAVPGEPRSKVLSITAKGRELQFTVQQPASEHELVVIHFDLKEE